MTSSTRSKPKEVWIKQLQADGYAEATYEQKHAWVRDGTLTGFDIVIVPGGGLWIKKEVGNA